MSDDHDPGPSRRVRLRLHEVPLLPAPLAELLRVANNPTASARDLRDAVEQVPTFAARVVQALGARESTAAVTLDDALRDVGTRGVRGVVSALALAPLFDPAAARSVDPRRIAEHGVACALWAVEVAVAAGRQASAHLLTAALMHDVGVVLLDRAAPDAYAEALERAQREGRHHVEVEREDLGTTHARAGAVLCARWMLPPRITELVAAHHAETLDDPELRLLVAADHLAARHGAATFGGSVPRAVPSDLWKRLGLGPGSLDELDALAPGVVAQTRAIRRAAAGLDVRQRPGGA